VGLIEIDVDPATLLPTSARMPRRFRPRLNPTAPTPGAVERLAADLPQLKLELRAELRRFLARLQTASQAAG
jgi:hypothetical protein